MYKVNIYLDIIYIINISLVTKQLVERNVCMATSTQQTQITVHI